MDDKILNRISRRYTLDKTRNDEFSAYDNMVDMVYELPKGLKDRSDVVQYIDPGAHDAEKVAANIYDTYSPKWDIIPRGPDDADGAERLERWLEWQMLRANQHGETEPFREMMIHSLRYSMVSAQLDYLPYWLPKDRKQWNKQQKDAMKKGPFCVIVHHPSNVHYEMGAYGLRWVSTVSVVPAANVIDHWNAYVSETPDGKKVKSAIAEIEKLLEDDEEAEVTFVDYTDHEKRYVACWHNDTSSVDFDTIFDENNPVDVIEIVNAKNDLPFINWTVSVGSSDSLLATLHKGNLWKNTNDSETIKRTSAYRRAFYPLFIEEGVGEESETDFSGMVDKIVVPPSRRLTPIMPPPLDPAFNELSAQDRATMSATTSTQNLTNMGSGTNVQFATIQAIIQVNLSQLVSYKRTVEKALRDLGNIAFQWVSASGDSVMAMRSATMDAQRVAGEQIFVGPNDFDEEFLFIDVDLTANTPTDKLQQVNMVAQLTQIGAPIPWAEHMEKLGYENPEALYGQWEDEQVRRIALQNFGKQLDAQLQMQMQQAQQQAQMQQQQQAQQQPQQPPGMFPEGQANDPNMGGSSPYESAPVGRMGQ